MIYFIIKRSLRTIVLLMCLSLITFLLSKCISTDPIEKQLLEQNVLGGGYDQQSFIEEYKTLAVTQHLNKPLFYFSIKPDNYPKNLNNVIIPFQKEIAINLLKDRYQWSDIKPIISKIKLTDDIEDVKIKLGNPPKKTYFPKIYWHGLNNQYQIWMSSFFSPTWGLSSISGSGIKVKVINSIKWSLALGLLAFIISFFGGTFLGYANVVYNKKIFNQFSIIFNIIYALPLFWFSTICLIGLTTDDYGSMTNLFPSSRPIESSFIDKLYFILLPVICLGIHSISYVSSQMKTSINKEKNKLYFLGALSKGLHKTDVYKKHILKNALSPMISLGIKSLPNILAGSLVVEIIFNVPGIGRLLYDSINLSDWGVVFPITLLIGLFTSISFTIGDVLYQWINPKTRLTP